MATTSQPKNQQRTAVIYFGSERETYLHRRASRGQRSVSAVDPTAVNAL